MNAAGRVNRPRAISAPPTISSQAAASSIGGRGSGAPGCGMGKWKTFIRPCSMKSRATTIRKTLSTRGAHTDNLSICRFLGWVRPLPSSGPGVLVGHPLDGDIVGLAAAQDGHLGDLEDLARHRQLGRA